MSTPSDHKVMPDDRTIFALSDALAYHSRLNPPSGKCSCGHEVRLGARFTEHQVRILLESEAGQQMLVEREALRATVARVEALIFKWQSPGLVCDCGHPLDQHNSLGCYAYVSYNPLASCGCPETDDRYEEDFAIRDLRDALRGDQRPSNTGCSWRALSAGLVVAAAIWLREQRPRRDAESTEEVKLYALLDAFLQGLDSLPELPAPPMHVLRSGPPEEDTDLDALIEQTLRDLTCEHPNQVTQRTLCQKDGERVCTDCGLAGPGGRPDASWTKTQMVVYASLHHIDLTAARTKADVLQTITDHIGDKR